MKKILFLIPVVIFFIACEDVINVDLNEEDSGLYAVEAKITTQDQPYVFLTKGLPVNVDEEFEGISNAVVTLTDDASPVNSIVLEEDRDRKGYYTVPEGKSYPGIPSREYTVRIEIEGVELSATDQLSVVEKIDSISIWPSLRGDKRFLAIFTYGMETPGPGNYYKWEIYINGTLLNNAEFISIANDEMVDGSYVNGLEIFTDYHNPHVPAERKLQYLDTVYAKQISISEFAFDYYVQLINQSMGGGLFSVPAANIQSNFVSSDGKEVLGLFTAHDVSTSNVVIIDDEIENQLVE